MRPAVSLKTLYRSPGKTIITFLLLAVLTFSLFLQVAEYHATAKEFAENVDMYVGTGYVEKAPATYTGYKKLQYPYYIATDPRVDTTGLPDLSCYDYPSLTAGEVEELTALPYISSVYSRYMTAGRSVFPRLRDDVRLWDNNSLMIVEGVLREPCLVAYGPDPFYPCPNEQSFSLTDAELLAGDWDFDLFKNEGPARWQYAYNNLRTHFGSEYMAEHFPAALVMEGDLYFCPTPWSADDVPFMQEDWVPTAASEDMNMYNVDGSYEVGNVILQNYCYGLNTQKNWLLGNRYVFVLRGSHENCDLQSLSLNLYDWLSEHYCPAVWDVTDAPENYLDLPEYAPLKKLIEIVESDLNTLDVVYADDMSAIRLVKDGKMTLTDGRWLTPEDTAAGAKVCMLDEKFARTYGLKVGDTLPLELGNELFEQFYNLGAIAGTVERYSDTWTPAEFEIVGLYKTSGGSFAAAKEPNWSYSINTVFVPLSSLPETVDLTGHEYAPGEFTFRVDNAWDIAEFLETSAPKIEAMGLTLMFDDGGWMEVYKPYAEAQRIVLLRIMILAAVTVLVTAFVAFLFISRKKKDYAIMRALGTPREKSNSSLLLPLMVLTAVSVAVGLTASTVYVARVGTMGAPSAGLVLLCGGAELMLALLLALLMLHGLSRKSPLALLQGEQTKQRIRRGGYHPPAAPAGAEAPDAGGKLPPLHAEDEIPSVGRDDPGTPKNAGAQCAPLQRDDQPFVGRDDLGTPQTAASVGRDDPGTPYQSLPCVGPLRKPAGGRFLGSDRSGFAARQPCGGAERSEAEGLLPGAVYHNPPVSSADSPLYTRGPLVEYHPRHLRFTLRYISRHIRRSAVKSLLSILVAALMLAAVAQLGHMRIVYDQLQVDTVVTAKFNMSLVTPKLQQLVEAGLASEVYYEQHLPATLVCGPEFFAADLEVTSDLERYVGVSCQVNYAPDHSAEDLAGKGKYVVLGTELMAEHELMPGDTIYLCKQDQKGMTLFYVQALTELQKEDPDLPMAFEAMFERHPEYMEQAIRELCDCFTIIGTVTTGNSTFDNMIFTSGIGTEKDFKNDTLLEYVEFRIPDNARAREMKQRGEEMTSHRSGAFSIDIEKLESVERTAYLLETLYPIVVALTLIIGAFLCALIILQTAKDAAIMRIQGTTAAMTRAILALEQVLLAVLGVGIGLVVMAAIKGHDFQFIAAQTLTFGGAYIIVAAAASTVSAVLATRKNLLELLQTKE